MHPLIRNILFFTYRAALFCPLFALSPWTLAQGATQTAKLTLSRTDHPLVTLDPHDTAASPEGGYLKGISYQDLMSFSHTADGWGGGFASLVTVDRTSRDDRKIFIRDRLGNETSLRDLHLTADAYHGEAALSRHLGIFELKADGRSSLGHDLFFTKQFTASLTASLLAEGVRLGVQASQTESHRPSSTFLDRDFRTKYRPVKVVADTAQATVEQIIGERNKVALALSTAAATAERPSNVGSRIQTATAILDTLFFKTDLSTQREQRNSPLMNERGYFDLQSGALGVAYEPWYDILLECEGGYMHEGEMDPRVHEKRALISRSLGLGASIKRFQPGIDLGFLATELDTKEILLSMEGALIWNF